jgi:hypothetical protein
MMKKILFILITFCSISIFAKTESDTITTWRLFKDKELLFEGNEFNKNPNVGLINLKLNFKYLEFTISYDFFNNITNKKIEFVVNNKVAETYTDNDYSNAVFKISGDKIYNFLLHNNKKIITIKYYDDVNKKGIIIGKLKIKV